MLDPRSSLQPTTGRTVVATLALAAILGGCGSNDHPAQTSPPPSTSTAASAPATSTAAPTPSTAPAPPAKRRHRPHPKRRKAAAALPTSYFGLGATVATFKAQNPSFPPGRIPLGLFSYSVDRTSNGRVTAATLKANTKPKLGAFDLASSFALPDDKEPLNDSSTCRLWRSKTLGEVLGLAYVISVADTATQTAHAELQASKPSCT